ncbi:zinc finger domain-containing protein, partial [Collinsella aerofaciens]
CGGRGHIDVDLSFLFGAGTFQTVCPECGGSGKVVADPCPDCGGSGRTRVTSEQTIEFPAGTHDGDEVRIPNMGHAGTNGASGGDLVGRAHVEAERLEGKARTGFYLMGIIAPFLVLSAISGVFSAFAMMCFIPFAMGLFMVLSDGVLHRSLLWWKRGAMQFANGFANGFMFALVSVWFASCSQRAVLSPYQMQ